MYAITLRSIAPAGIAAVLAACAPSTLDPSAQGAPAQEEVRTASAPAPGSAAGSSPGMGAPPDFTALVDKVGPAVVNVATSRTAASVAGMSGAPGDPLFEFFRRFMPPESGDRGFRSRGVGSGFVIDAQGHILTNAHVVEGADEVVVRLADGKGEFKAQVVGTDRQTDVALLKVDATGLPVAPMGDSAALRPGEWVAAIGSPFGFANTITAGIVSATERLLPNETYVPFIQTDVAVNPGNSGGPLLNLQGQVIGINSQIYSRTGGYMGLSFAIPIDVAMEVAEQLRTDGKVTRGRLGVGIQEISPELAQSFGMEGARGVLVTNVDPDSAAARAGMAAGDIVTRFGDKPVAGASDFPRMVARTAPGTEVEVEVWRDGELRRLDVTIGEAPTEVARRAAPAPQAGQTAGRLGLVISELPPVGRRALGVDYGLVVQGVSGVNAEAPLQRGDVIVAIGNQGFRSVNEFNAQVEKVPPGSTVALLVRRGQDSLFVPVEVAPG